MIQKKGVAEFGHPLFLLKYAGLFKMKYLILLTTLFAPSVSFAENLTFQSDDSVLIVRGIDNYGIATFEFIGAAGQIYQCIALDSDGNPLAVSTAMADVGQILFTDLEVTTVEKVTCRKV